MKKIQEITKSDIDNHLLMFPQTYSEEFYTSKMAKISGYSPTHVNNIYKSAIQLGCMYLNRTIKTKYGDLRIYKLLKKITPYDIRQIIILAREGQRIKTANRYLEEKQKTIEFKQKKDEKPNVTQQKKSEKLDVKRKNPLTLCIPIPFIKWLYITISTKN